MTVTNAFTAPFIIQPLSDEIPEGISTDRTNAPVLFIILIVSAYLPSTSRDKPIPKTASTTQVKSDGLYFSRNLSSVKSSIPSLRYSDSLVKRMFASGITTQTL